MFEFEATTYEIPGYVYIKGDRPAKSVDHASIKIIKKKRLGGLTTFGGCVKNVALCITQRPMPAFSGTAFLFCLRPRARLLYAGPQSFFAAIGINGKFVAAF